MVSLRNLIPLLLLVLFSCNDSPTNSVEDSLPKVSEDEQYYDPWLSPNYYTDFDISGVDSIVVTWESTEVKEFMPPYSVKIADKKANSTGKLWSFTLEDSLCTCNNYYFALRNNTDSTFYSFSVSSEDTSIDLTAKQSITELPWK